MSIKNVMKRSRFDFFLFAMTASFYLLNNFILKKISTGIFYYFFVCYFNDLICPLGFFAYVNIMLSFINKKLEKFYQILISCFVCGLIWEFVAPLLKKSSVTDFYDLLCYCIGGILYWVTIVIKNSNEKGERK